MNMQLTCIYNGAKDLMIFCPGAADTAEIADRAVRKVHRKGAAKMFWLAAIGGRAGKSLIAVDGCDTDGAKRTLELAGFRDFVHIRVTDLGSQKGETEVASERIDMVAGRVREALNAPAARADQ